MNIDYVTGIYFAHSLRDYGTENSKNAMQVIAKIWPRVEIANPEDFEADFQKVFAELKSWPATYEKIILDKTGSLPIVVVLEYKDFTGRGVYEEVLFALKKGFPVFVIKGNHVEPVLRIDIVDLDNWVLYAKINSKET
jgi:hypothetical protein